ncbi:MAG: hypothetical protein AB7F37_19880 [Variibacter sp.]
MDKMSGIEAYARRLNTRAFVSTASFIVAAAGMTALFAFGVALAFFAHPVGVLALAGMATLALALAIISAP